MNLQLLGMPRKILFTGGLILIWTVAVIAAVLAEACWFARPAVVRGDFASLERHLVHGFSQAIADRDLGSGALVLVRGGEIVSEHGFGVANAETQTPVKNDRTLYVVASVSKAVTAWGVMKLVEEGRLGLDEPVMRYLKRWRFPGSEEHRDRVTVRHLLSHTAGLDDGLGYGGFLPGETVQTLEESLTLTKDSTAWGPRAVVVAREPGQVMAYSGGGYTVLQLLIEEITNRPFADYMRDAVLRPLGMMNASFDLDSIITEGRAQDLATAYDRSLNPCPHRRYTAQAAVSLRATPRDLARFVLAFVGENPVLRPETLKQMLRPQPENQAVGKTGESGIAGNAASWGLGHTLFVANDAGGYVVGHDGGTAPAMGAAVRVNPATGNGIVAVSSGGSGLVSRLGDGWIYWETGKIRDEMRMQIVYDRLTPALIAIVLGAILLALWQMFRLRTASKPR